MQSKKQMLQKLEEIEYKVLYLEVRAEQLKYFYPKFYNSVQELSKEVKSLRRKIKKL